MAIVRSNKSKGIKAVSTKDKYLNKMKALTKYLIDPDERLLQMLLSDKIEVRKLKFRSITYLLKYPKLIYYINKHLNHIYNFESFDNREWFITMSEICRSYHILDTNGLYFTKFKTDDSSEFTKVIKKYASELNISEPSNSEINAFYILFKKGIITENNVEQLKLVIDGKDTSSTAEKKIQQLTENSNNPFPTTVSQNQNVELIFDNLPIEIQKFSNMVTKYIKTRNTCKNCPLTNKTPVVIDTNLSSPGPVDLFILGLNANEYEYKTGLPFTDKPGKIFRKFLEPLVKKFSLTYVITNCILCWTKTTQDIANINNTSKNCKVIIDEIKQNFPPKIIIALGTEVKNSVGIKGGITKLNGQMIDGHFIMIHPDTILKNPNQLSKFEHAFENLEVLLKSNNISPNHNKNIISTSLHNIPKSKIVTKFGPNLTLFDIKHIGEQIVYILNDENGEKKYLIEEILFPIYIKSGDYKDCKLISNNVEAVAFLTAQQKIELNKSLYHNLRSIVDIE